MRNIMPQYFGLIQRLSSGGQLRSKIYRKLPPKLSFVNLNKIIKLREALKVVGVEIKVYKFVLKLKMKC